tara:strand:- start:3245 stop:3454 length:210 start_codon:yes stop_codon:yes gene_type:complete
MIPAAIIRLIVPKILEMVITQFKMDEVMDYVFKKNDLDSKVEELRNELDSVRERIIFLERKKNDTENDN